MPIDPQDLISAAKIVGWYGTLITSSGDVDRNPDEVPVEGTVTFTPTVAAIRVTSTSPQLQLPLGPFVATLDTAGYLTDGDQQGIYLPNPADSNINPRLWGYKVDYSLTYAGSKRALGSFTFTFAGTADVDLATVTPVATFNGVAVTQGPAGAPGAGIIIRDILVGTASTAVAVLTAAYPGFGATQNGWAYRVRSSLTGPATYDELWAWEWTGSSGAWRDLGPFFVTGVIDDTTASSTSTYSSQEVETRLTAVLNQAEAYTDQLQALLAGAMVAVTRAADGTWNVPSSLPGAFLVFIGTGDMTDIPTQYLVDGQTAFEGLP